MTGILDLRGKPLHQSSWDLFYNYISLSAQPCSTEMLTSCERCQIGGWRMSPSSWITRIFARAAAATFMCRQHLEAMCFTLSRKIQLSFTSFINVFLWMPSTFILHLLRVVISHVRIQIAVSVCIAPWRRVCSLFIRHCNVCWRWMHCWNIATAPKRIQTPVPDKHFFTHPRRRICYGRREAHIGRRQNLFQAFCILHTIHSQYCLIATVYDLEFFVFIRRVSNLFKVTLWLLLTWTSLFLVLG